MAIFEILFPLEIGVILFLSINTLQIHSWNRKYFAIVFWPTSFQCSLLYPLESTENFSRGYKNGILGRNQWTGISKGKRNGWSRHIWCAILLNYKMDLLHMPSLGILVPERPWQVFYATRCQVYRGQTHNFAFCWYSGLISHTHRHSTFKGR